MRRWFIDTKYQIVRQTRDKAMWDEKNAQAQAFKKAGEKARREEAHAQAERLSTQ